MSKLCVIDYGSGNLAAITNICERERISHYIAASPDELQEATHFLLPGVGAFDPTIEIIEKSGMLAALEDQVQQRGKPILGICVGMHLLADGSDEGVRKGLSWIPGRVREVDVTALKKPPYLPHMGWNSVTGVQEDELLAGVDLGHGFYFLHSYYFAAERNEDVVATVSYGADFPCVVRRGHVVGAQFHPEKSHANGVRLLKNFVGMTSC